jgi:dTDP-D-glucose 4,6-dehydratase
MPENGSQKDPQYSWEDGLRETIKWYAENRDRWLQRIDWL